MRREKVDVRISGDGDRIIVPTAEESQVIDEQIASDPDGFELDDAWFEGAKTTRELFLGALPRSLRTGGARGGGPEGWTNQACNRHPGPGDDILVQVPDRGDRRDTLAGAGRADPPGSYPGQHRAAAPVPASGKLRARPSHRVKVHLRSYPENPFRLVCSPKLKPRWDVHLRYIGDWAGILAEILRPLIAGWCGSDA